MISWFIKDKEVRAARKKGKKNISVYIEHNCMYYYVTYANLLAAIKAKANLLFCPPESEATGRSASSPDTP